MVLAIYKLPLKFIKYFKKKKNYFDTFVKNIFNQIYLSTISYKYENDVVKLVYYVVKILWSMDKKGSNTNYHS